MLGRKLLLIAACLFFSSAVHAGELFEHFLETHCVRCHGPQKEEGDIRIDRLSRDFKAGLDTHHWAEALEKVNSGEMPPETEPRPTQSEIAAFITNLDSFIKEGRAERMAAPHRPQEDRENGCSRANFACAIWPATRRDYHSTCVLLPQNLRA